MRHPSFAALDLLIDEFLHGRMEFVAFSREFGDIFLEALPDDVMTAADLEYYGLVHERAGWTAEAPPRTDRAFGWQSADEYRAWLLEFTRRRLSQG